jgi:hypothetical protein
MATLDCRDGKTGIASVSRIRKVSSRERHLGATFDSGQLIPVRRHLHA